MTLARRRLLLGSTAALGLGALTACTSDESWSGRSSDGSPAGGSSADGSSADPSAGSAGTGEFAAGRPSAIAEVLPASTLLALGDGKVLRLGTAPDTVELDHHGAVLWSVGGTGTEPGRFHGIVGATVGPDGSFWIVDGGNRRVQVLTPTGTPSRVVGAPDATNVPLRRPVAVAVAPDGRSYVGDAGRSGVVPFAADGTPGALIAGFGSDHPIAGISAVQVADDELVVVEALAPRVQIRDLDGTWLRSLELPAHFATADVAVDGHRLYLVSLDGRLVRTTLDGSTTGSDVEDLGHSGAHARGLHLGADGLAVAAVPVPSYVIR